MSEIHIPVKVIGPGSQPQEIDEAELDIMQLPGTMDTYHMPLLPEPEQVVNLDEARNRLFEILFLLKKYQLGQPVPKINVTELDSANLDLIDQVLGEGEVSIIFSDAQFDKIADSTTDRVPGNIRIRIQESVLAGVWRIRQLDELGNIIKDEIEIAAIPGLVMEQTFTDSTSSLNTRPETIPEGVFNAPPLLAEINDKVNAYQDRDDAHVINLTLLPQTEQDLVFLNKQLGQGKVSILSRGYGNCRISSTATKNVWWVQYYNSQDKNILNSIEITRVPEVACAAPEDIYDSAVRLQEIMELYQ